MELMTRVAFVFHMRKQGHVHKVHGVYVKSAAGLFGFFFPSCLFNTVTESEPEQPKPHRDFKCKSTLKTSRLQRFHQPDRSTPSPEKRVRAWRCGRS